MAENRNSNLIRVLLLFLVLYGFLVSLDLMSISFKLFGSDLAKEIISLTSNKFVALFIGLLSTATIQSSSTTTSMIVAMTAAGTITLENAVPMIIGANIGTSVTSTIVALGHIGKKREYAKAVSAATVHDFFNILVTLVLFPIEIMFGAISKSAVFLADFFIVSETQEQSDSIIKIIVSPISKGIVQLSGETALICLLISAVMIFLSLRFLTSLLKEILIGKVKDQLNQYLFQHPLKALTWGTLSTAMVQSSSITTSLIVPLVASKKVLLRDAFPFLMGANIGTMVTALIAALSNGEAALSIALAHVFFNLFGVLILFPIPFIREIPVRFSILLGKATLKRPYIGILYIILVFFLIPFLLIFLTK